ncbi:MAG: hypothetical protein JOZ62_08790 [Acidobacteriaceae bacterium]|nr:hypothetical protein [Acidobacteriaceae bacterium]
MEKFVPHASNAGDGKGLRDETFGFVMHSLRRHPKARRILISAATDESALGARAAIENAGLTRTVAIMGHGGSQ